MKETVFSTLSGILMRKVDKQSFFQEEKVVRIIIFEFFTIKLRLKLVNQSIGWESLNYKYTVQHYTVMNQNDFFAKISSKIYLKIERQIA